MTQPTTSRYRLIAFLLGGGLLLVGLIIGLGPVTGGLGGGGLACGSAWVPSDAVEGSSVCRSALSGRGVYGGLAAGAGALILLGATVAPRRS